MGDDNFSNKDEAFQAFDDIPLSPPDDDTIGAVIARRYSRRDILKGSLAVTAATALFGTAALQSASGPAKAASAGFRLPRTRRRRRRNPPRGRGLRRRHPDPLGRPARQGMKPFDPSTLTAEEQAGGSAITTTTSPSSRSTAAARAGCCASTTSTPTPR